MCITLKRSCCKDLAKDVDMIGAHKTCNFWDQLTVKAELCCARTVWAQDLQSYFTHIHLRSSSTLILLLLSKKTVTPSYKGPPNDSALGHFHRISFFPAEYKWIECQRIWKFYENYFFLSNRQNFGLFFIYLINLEGKGYGKDLRPLARASGTP